MTYFTGHGIPSNSKPEAGPLQCEHLVVENHNLRQVQYKGGLKYVTSKERHQLNNLENLQGKLEKHYPLNYNL